MPPAEKPKTGRPVANTKEVKVRLREDEHQALKDAGGSEWVRTQLQLKRLVANRRLTIDTALFTEDERRVFLKGWIKAGGFEKDSDRLMPWTRKANTQIEVTTDNVSDMGAEYWKTCQNQFFQFLANEQNKRTKDKE